MGLLVNGKWVDQWYDTKKTGGRFMRQESSFRDAVGTADFPAEANRYHLYVSLACPWAHRAVIFRQLKELESLVSMTVVNAEMGDYGWVMDNDSGNNKRYLHEVYTLAKPDYNGRVTVPVLWDKTRRTVVNNESSEIIRMFNSAFDDMTGNRDDYYPQAHRDAIDEINQFVYTHINNGVYKTGFATTQAVYEEEVGRLFNALDALEQRLAEQRYLVGNIVTEADWRLFTTLVRFDAVYVGHFKCNVRRIADYPKLSNYLRDLYQTEGVAATVDMTHIKTHYYASHKNINPTGIVPVGPDMNLAAAHDRG